MGREKDTSQPTLQQCSRLITPNIDDFIMQVLGMSQARYGNGWIVGRNAFNDYRPAGWPKMETVMVRCGLTPTYQGWCKFIEMHIGLPVMNRKELQRRRQKNHQSWCKVCGKLENWRSGFCGACYRYWLDNRRKRPRHLWDDEVRCKNCGIPLASLGKYDGGSKRQKCGYCEPCYNYQSRYDKPRPRRLWLDGPYGFCECGYPAVALVEDIPVCVRHKE